MPWRYQRIDQRNAPHRKHPGARSKPPTSPTTPATASWRRGRDATTSAGIVGAEFAYLFLLPELFCILALVVFAAMPSRPSASEPLMLGLTRRRLALGLLGVVAVVLACALIDAAVTTQEKVELQHIARADAVDPMLSYAALIFAILLMLMAALSLIFGLPIAYALYRVRLFSMAGVTACATLVALGCGAFFVPVPMNPWCATHAWECSATMSLWAAAVAVPSAIAFGLGARLPWLRSKPTGEGPT